MIEYILAENIDAYEKAKQLFQEYADYINIDLKFQKFDEELENLPVMYGAQNGGIILCKQDVRYIGCIAIRKIDDDTCELKRMYVRSTYREKGVGKNLLLNAIKLAQQLNYKKVRLDTLDYMTPAIRLYEECGFRKTAPYYHNPNTTAVFFEKSL